MRDGYVYTMRTPFSKNKYGTHTWLFVWSESYTNENLWTGRWETRPLMFNGEFGRIQVAHSLPPEKHHCFAAKWIADKYSEYLVPNSKSKDVVLVKDEWAFLIRELIKKDMSLTPVDIIVKIKTVYPNAILPDRKSLNTIISVERNKSLRIQGKLGMTDVSAIKTFRNTDFGRGVGFSLVEGKPKYFVYLYSDFQKQVVEEAKKD